MCFFDQHRYMCGHWKWGHFRQHCNREYRTGETCGMKLIMETFPTNSKCKLCEKVETKFRRQEAEAARILRWDKAGGRYIRDSMDSGETVVAQGDLSHGDHWAEKLISTGPAVGTYPVAVPMRHSHLTIPQTALPELLPVIPKINKEEADGGIVSSVKDVHTRHSLMPSISLRNRQVAYTSNPSAYALRRLGHGQKQPRQWTKFSAVERPDFWRGEDPDDDHMLTSRDKSSHHGWQTPPSLEPLEGGNQMAEIRPSRKTRLSFCQALETENTELLALTEATNAHLRSYESNSDPRNLNRLPLKLYSEEDGAWKVGDATLLKSTEPDERISRTRQRVRVNNGLKSTLDQNLPTRNKLRSPWAAAQERAFGKSNIDNSYISCGFGFGNRSNLDTSNNLEANLATGLKLPDRLSSLSCESSQNGTPESEPRPVEVCWTCVSRFESLTEESY